MINQTTGRDEVAAMEAKYQDVLAWEAQFTNEITASKVTYTEKNKGARYVVSKEFEKNKPVYRIWDREEKKHLAGNKYTTKRAAQNEIDDMGC